MANDMRGGTNDAEGRGTRRGNTNVRISMAAKVWGSDTMYHSTQATGR